MVEGETSEKAKEVTVSMFEDALRPVIKKVYGDSKLRVTDIIRRPELEEKGKQKSYDTHFILNLLEAEIKEGTEPFRYLERLLCTGLEVVDED